MRKTISKVLTILCSSVLLLASGCSSSYVPKSNKYATDVSNATAFWQDGSEFTPVLRFVTTADTHFKDVYFPEIDKRLANMFEDVYAYAGTQQYNKVDAVVFAGDVCDFGSEAQYQRLMDCWTSNIKDETAFLCLQAGHELISGNAKLHTEYTGNEVGEHVTINGFHFITISNLRWELDENGEIILNTYIVGADRSHDILTDEITHGGKKLKFVPVDDYYSNDAYYVYEKNSDGSQGSYLYTIKTNNLVSNPLNYDGYTIYLEDNSITGSRSIFYTKGATKLIVKRVGSFEPYSACNAEWLKTQLDEAEKDGKPIFTFHHHPVPETIMFSSYGAPAWTDSQPVSFSYLLEEHQSVIDFTGHTHIPLTHPRAIMQDKFTEINAGMLFYGGESSDFIIDEYGDEYRGELSATSVSAGDSFCNIVEVDANGRIRIMPYNINDRVFCTELGTDKVNTQLIRYIEDVYDKSTWLYTADRYDTADIPKFNVEDPIGNFTFGTFKYQVGVDGGGNPTYNTLPTIKFTLTVATDKEGIELYYMHIKDENGDLVDIYCSSNWTGTSVTSINTDTNNYINPRYASTHIFDTIDVQSRGIVGLVSGKTYTLELVAVDTFHKQSDVITKTFTYEEE